ncbi:hypothetical protein [Pedobacter sp. FW305-3-2-15-E-R2A2]|uniref:hypothetical protein n=1 Tax=Pedobacter sp. FW305-3-2-15-E-R2A2 TaxID=3140251 RepID=UPI00313FEED0
MSITSQLMRKYKLMLLLVFATVAISCEKVTNVRLVEGESSGKMSYRLVDDSGAGLPGIRVGVYKIRSHSSDTYFDPSSLLDSVRTDKDGVAVFPMLAPANYLVVPDSPKLNNVLYNISEFVQVVAGKEKKKITKISDFSGVLRVTLKSSLDYITPIRSMGIALIPYNPLIVRPNNLKELLDGATIKGVTNHEGFVSIKIPADISYRVLIYGLYNKTIIYGSDEYRVQKDGIAYSGLYMDPTNQ